MHAERLASYDREEAQFAWRVLTVTILGSVLSALNIAVLNVALPVVARHLRPARPTPNDSSSPT